MDIQGLEKLSLVDYDGYAAATVFLAGCNLRCPFCHNAVLVEGGAVGGIPEEDFFAFLASRRRLLDAVCITGGEPTLRRDLPAFCRKIHEAGYRVKLDTNGTSPGMLRTLCEEHLLDYVALDVKAPLHDYPSLLGAEPAEAEAVGESIRYLMSGVIPYEFRTTLVAEMIDEAGIREIGQTVAGAPLLFLQCFRDRGGNLTDGLTPVPVEVARRYQEILAETVGRVVLRGYD